MFSDHIIQYSGDNYSGQSFIEAGKASTLVNLTPTEADPRINATFIYNSYNRTSNGKIVNLFPRLNKGNNAFPQLNKYGDLSYNGTTTSRNLILFRYADILLLRAEVENELSGPANAYGYVNQLLLRARTTSSGTTTQPANWDGTTVANQEDFRARILKEREYELNGEGHEWFDMRRRGLGYFQEQIDHHNAAVVFYKSTNNKDFIFENIETQMNIPIPLIEISGNRLISE
jgi:hypothetical protein